MCGDWTTGVVIDLLLLNCCVVIELTKRKTMITWQSNKLGRDMQKWKIKICNIQAVAIYPGFRNT